MASRRSVDSPDTGGRLGEFGLPVKLTTGNHPIGKRV